jgi:hypothetical protein
MVGIPNGWEIRCTATGGAMCAAPVAASGKLRGNINCTAVQAQLARWLRRKLPKPVGLPTVPLSLNFQLCFLFSQRRICALLINQLAAQKFEFEYR